VFGGPRWRDLVGHDKAVEYVRSGAVPVMLDPDGEPVLRNFVHVDDLIDAITLAVDNPKARQQTFNVCMDEPVNYRDVATYLAEARQHSSVEVHTPYRSTWLDNTKAKFLLDWRPAYDLPLLIDSAWDFVRAPDDPRTVVYPG
jgi:nucleoside-diphosphate-sugar epimerase